MKMGVDQKRLNMLSTTCPIYFGNKLGASANGRMAGMPISDGTLLNQRFLPDVLEGDGGIEKLAHPIRTYFRLNGHHIQLNIIDSQTLRIVQAMPDDYRDLLVRVAGYSDYFVELDRHHQEEIIARTGQGAF